MEFPILSLLIFLPVVGALILAFIPKEKTRLVQGVAVLSSLVTFALSLCLWWRFQPGSAEMQFVEKYDWIPQLRIQYHLGVDGLSLFLVILSAFLAPIVIISALSQITKHIKEFYISFLVLVSGMIGVFLALDLFLFYIFWEVMLIPMYLLIGIWGGKRRIYATVKFFIYTMAGSLVMLLAILYVGIKGDTFNLLDLAHYSPAFSGTTQLLLFGAFALSFLIKIPTFPFHTWLPDAHVEAPTAGSVILAGVLLKMGIYGFIRFCFPLFPYACMTVAPWMCILGLVGIIYGAMMAYVQSDIKKLIAYSSISHMGFVVLGIFTFNQQGLSGGIYQMLNHGISTGALFLLVGILYERRHTREISEYGGIAKVVPTYATIFLIVTLSSIGLPGTNGFVGEFLIFLGTFQAFGAGTFEAYPDLNLGPYLAAVATLGVVLGAIYMLSMYRRVFFGKVTNKKNEKLEDMNTTEKITLIPLVIMIFVMGLLPNIFLQYINPTSKSIVEKVKKAQNWRADHQIDTKSVKK